MKAPPWERGHPVRTARAARSSRENSSKRFAGNADVSSALKKDYSRKRLQHLIQHGSSLRYVCEPRPQPLDFLSRCALDEVLVAKLSLKLRTIFLQFVL